MITIIEVLIILILGVVVFGMYQLSKIRRDNLNLKNLEAYQDTGDYTNIALFGLDSRDAELERGVRSDSMMIASISNKTKEVKVVSVYRDCIMRQKDGSYNKANAAYSFGGGEEAIAELNRNLDLDIKNYISVNFIAVVKAVDAVGGVEIDVQPEEIPQINRYMKEVKEASGVSSPKVTKAGKQTLNGVQATSYARIRKTDGGDFKRTERQRLVLKKLLEKAKDLKVRQLKKLADEIIPYMATSLSNKEILSLAVNIPKYKLAGNEGFPFDVQTMNNPRNLVGSFVVPVDLYTNVRKLHKYCFNKKHYKPSDTVEEISNDISWLTGFVADHSEDDDNED